MNLIADILLISGALGSAFYCLVLSRRLRRFTDLERGVGGAVAVLSSQVDEMNQSLVSAQTTATSSVAQLAEVNARAEAAARRLELLVASLHDLPKERPEAETASPFYVRKKVSGLDGA